MVPAFRVELPQLVSASALSHSSRCSARKVAVVSPLPISTRRSVLKAGGDPHQTDGEDEDRDEDLAQTEAELGVAHWLSHRTLTRPVAATTTVRVPLRVGFVTV